VPNLGPIFSSVPAILLALFGGGPVQALLVGGSYIIIQQFENIFLVPRVMGNAVGLKPLFVIVGMLIGFSLLGGVGAILAVPVMAIIQICIEFYLDLQKLKAKGIL